jgi:hypothetical protein
MFDMERGILIERGVELYAVAKNEDIGSFENAYQKKLPFDIRAFYVELNGYFDSDEMVNIYSLDKVKRISERDLGIGNMDIDKDLFIIGDFCFQGSFWLLDIKQDSSKYFALNLGKIDIIEVADSFEYFLANVLRDPYAMIGYK